ncbi:MAG TPA: hypothetical protein VNE39_00940 [Planctomycetota bacterium]|nr:hypothetical protein [Planctomycetota bacterium]
MNKPAAPAKGFDCVEMKRRIQEKIYAETRGMGQDQLLAYFRRRVAASRFAPFFGLKPRTKPRKPARKNTRAE